MKNAVHNRFEYLYLLTSSQFKIIGSVIKKFMQNEMMENDKYVYNVAPVLQNVSELNINQPMKIVSSCPIYEDHQEVVLEYQQKRNNRFLTQSVRLRFEQVKQMIYFKRSKKQYLAPFSNQLVRNDYVIKSGYKYTKESYYGKDNSNLKVSFAYDFRDLVEENVVSDSYVMAISSNDELPSWLVTTLKLVVKDVEISNG